MMFNHKLDKEKIKKYLQQCGPETRIYLGCDSERFRLDGGWYADYTLCIVIHINGKNGAKIFGEVQRERLYDQTPQKPSLRLMTEVYKISEIYQEFQDILEDFPCEIHLDINPNKKHKSNAVVQEAIGFIRGTCMIEPKIKPQAWAASYCADRYKGLRLVA